MAGLCGAVAIALVPLLHWHGMLAPLLLIPLLACTTLFDAAASSAQDSRIPEIAGFAEVPLRRVIAAKSVVGYAATLAAPLIAGAVARELGTVLTLWHSAIALLAGGAMSGLAMARCSDPISPEKHPADFSALVGSAALWRDGFLRSSILVPAGAVAMVSATSAVIVPRLLKMGTGDVQDYGSFIAAVSGGSMLGSVLYGMVGHRLSLRAVNTGGFALISMSMSLLGFFLSMPIRVIAGVLLGVALSPMAAAMSVVLFQRVDVQLRGRTFGVVTAMMTCMTPLAMVMAGYGVDEFGPQTVLVFLALVAGIAMLATPNFLSLDRTPREAEQ